MIISADVSPTLSDQQTFDMPEANITCAEGFYLSNSSVCHPLCSIWAEPSKDEYIIIQRTITASVIIGLISSLFFITIALTFYRSEMYVYCNNKAYVSYDQLITTIIILPQIFLPKTILILFLHYFGFFM